MSSKGNSLAGKNELGWSRVFTLLWGILLIGGATLFADTRNPVVELGLKIASFTYGGLLGTFFLGLLFKNTRQMDAYIGFIAGLLAMIGVLKFTRIDFTWHTFIGCMVTICIGSFSARMRLSRSPRS
jgi:Na+/proline symporter